MVNRQIRGNFLIEYRQIRGIFLYLYRQIRGIFYITNFITDTYAQTKNL